MEELLIIATQAQAALPTFFRAVAQAQIPPHTPLFPTPAPSCGEASAQSGLTPKHPWLELPKAIFFLFEKAHKTQGTEWQNL